MRLRTFGGLWIEADPAVPPLGPRRMGLLALVAAAGKRGITRERIIGILWGETEEEQARHTLSQNLYILRRETGRELIVASPELRLDPAITSDVGEFQEAIATNDPPRAAALYAGDFLDGFYLPGVPDFERWVEEERGRLKGAALRALESLASRADQNGNPQEAIGWWRRLADLDPLSARYAAGLMRSLAAAGDHSSALAHAKDHEETVKRELDIDPDPTLRALATTLRSPAAVPGVPPPVAPASTLVSTPVAEAPARPTAVAVDQLADEVAHRRRIRSLAPVLIGLVLLAAAVIGLRVRASAGPSRPFLAVGVIRPADTTALGGVLRDMLATSLGGIRGLQVVANSRLVELMPRGADTIPGATSDAARRAGATEILEGEMFPAPGGVSMRLRRVALKSGVVRQGYTVHAEDPTRLIDSAAAAIARDLGIQPPLRSVATIRTASPTAYALYEQGVRAYYQYDTPAAYRLMQAAVEQDSAFAMAAYYGWRASKELVITNEGDRDLLRRAKRLARRAIDRERLLIEGSVGLVDAPISTTIAVAETLAVRYPTDPDGQILLGEAYNAAGERARAVAAFERAVAMDSAAGVMAGSVCRLCTALSDMVEVYLWWDSAGAAERTARRLIALRPEFDGGWGILAPPLLRQGRRAEAAAALRWVPRVVFQRDMISSGRFEEVDRELLADLLSASTQIRSESRWLLLISLRNQGRLREAMALARDHVVPGSSRRVSGLPPEGTNLAILSMESGRPLEAARVYKSILASHLTHDWSTGFKARYGTWMLALAGTALAAAGDTAAVRRIADSAEQMGRLSNWGRDPRLHHFLRGLLLQREDRHAEAVESFRRAIHSTTDGYTRINLEMARSLMALGRAEEAVAILQPALRGGVDGGNTYVTHTELHEALAQALELARQPDSARAHYQAVERAWRNADPQFADRYGRAKAKAGNPS